MSALSKKKPGQKRRKPGKKGRGESLTSKRRIEAKERVAQAIELRKAGATYQRIADTVGYNSEQAAHKAVTDALVAMLREPAEELRLLEVERLDSLFLSAFPLAKQGVMTAIDRCLRIMERRARLLGLDAPVRVAVDWREELSELQEAGEVKATASEIFEELVATAMKIQQGNAK